MISLLVPSALEEMYIFVCTKNICQFEVQIQVAFTLIKKTPARRKKITNKVAHVCRKKNDLNTFNKVFQYLTVVYEPHLNILLYNL